jgi:uncharacterized protein involved in exopolysaccharide biosynthesis
MKSCDVQNSELEGQVSNTEEINIFDYYRVLKRHKKMIACILGVVSVLAVITSLLWPKTYTAEAVIMPVSTSGGGISPLASQFSGLASMMGVSLSGADNGAQKIVTILNSRTLIENVINSENLMPVLFEDMWDAKQGKWKSDNPEELPNMEAAVRAVRGCVIITLDELSFKITLSSASPDPKLAARVANAYLRELQSFINSNSLTAAKRNRIFIEQQLSDNKRELLESGKELAGLYRGGRISSSEANVDVDVGIDEDWRDAHPEPDASASSVELQALLNQKSDLDKKIGKARLVEDVPQQVFLTYLMMKRDLLLKVNALLTTQYEMAKIDETKEDLAFEVIDYAVPPVLRSSPKRTQMCILSFVTALFASVLIAFFREYLDRMRRLEVIKR